MSRVGLYRWVSIHKIQGSQCWDVHVWDREEIAQDYALSLLKKIERTAV
jgi:hypothetical protein